VKAFYYQYSN